MDNSEKAEKEKTLQDVEALRKRLESELRS